MIGKFLVAITLSKRLLFPHIFANRFHARLAINSIRIRRPTLDVPGVSHDVPVGTHFAYVGLR